MRYHYYYQTKENKSLDDWLVAKDRNDAYAQLRKRGIKPYKLVGRNPLAWKRWAAIGVLAAALVDVAGEHAEIRQAQQRQHQQIQEAAQRGAAQEAGQQEQHHVRQQQKAVELVVAVTADHKSCKTFSHSFTWVR